MDEKLLKLLDDLFIAYEEVTSCEHGPIQIFKVKGFENLRLKVLELVRYSEFEKSRIKETKAQDVIQDFTKRKSLTEYSAEELQNLEFLIESCLVMYGNLYLGEKSSNKQFNDYLCDLRTFFYSKVSKQKYPMVKLAKDTPRKIGYLQSLHVNTTENDKAMYSKINEIIQQLNLIIKEQI